MVFKKYERKFNPTQNWEETPELEGVFTEKRLATTTNGEQKVFVVETKDGPKDVWGNIVLTDFFENTKIGAMVKIKSLGKKQNPKTKRFFNDYDLQSDDSMVGATAEDAETIFNDKK